MLYTGYLGENFQFGWFQGTPYVDPNVGFTTQALGGLAVHQWFAGIVPWWNSYNGVGLPLSAEYQSAVFSPFTLLLLLPNGIIWRHLLIQIFAGGGCYALLRQLGLRRLACLTGALIFSQNGTFAWFGDAPAGPVVFLPWLLLGIERALVQATSNWRHGWRLYALSLAFMLLAGFPETAYIDGLFAFVWAMVRLLRLQNNLRFGTLCRLALGSIVGLALATPQILAFLESLPDSIIGGHNGAMGIVSLGPLAIPASLLTPYMFGPIFGSQFVYVNAEVWDFIGGYTDNCQTIVAAFGLWKKRNGISLMLSFWWIFAISRTFGLHPLADIWDVIPGISDVMFCRYATSTWELAAVILASFGVDSIGKNAELPRGAIFAAGLTALVTVTYLLIFTAKILPNEPIVKLRIWTSASLLWATFTSCVAIAALSWFRLRWRTGVIASLLVFDATIMFTIPTLSNPRNGTVDTAAIGYLQSHLGFARFYTLGPISPNFSAYFNIASINENYLPVSKVWGDWAQTNLDPAIDPLLFTGSTHRDPKLPSPSQELNLHLSAYQQVGVKYVLTPAGVDPFTETSPPKVYSDPLMDIYQLPAPAPYFETPGVACSLQPQSRTAVAADCPGPTTLIRRELFFPGWRAEINGHETPIIEQNGLFEAINLPAGQSKITYSYAPPHIIWAWLLMALALITLITPSFIRRPKTI
jgi:hypothetical protein